MPTFVPKNSLLFLFVIITGAGIAQTNLSDKIPVDAKVKIGKLDNGLTYYIRQNKKPEQKVELRLAINAGSILEDDDQQGLAHMAEHMAFNGTKNFKKNDIISFLQSIGVEFGNDLNAYTSFDETVYMLPIPTDKPGNLEKGFQILEDWAHQVSY
jgi:zinc protease